MEEIQDESNFVPDYGPMEDEIQKPENRIRGSAKDDKKGRPCPVCQGRLTNIRRHVLNSHLPWYIAPLTACKICKLQFGQERMLEIHQENFHDRQKGTLAIKDWVEKMNGLLDALWRKLKLKSLNEMLEFVCRDKRFRKCGNAFFHPSDVDPIKEFNRINNLKTDVLHRSYPPLHIYSLLHWKTLALLLEITGDVENKEKYESEQPLRKEKPEICVADAHLHLDILLKSKSVRYSDLPLYEQEFEDRHYKVSHLVSNFCFPHHWPSTSDRRNMRRDKRLQMTIGIHPRIINLERSDRLKEWIKDMRRLIDARGVVAIGECGLDSTDNPNSRELKKQVDVLEDQLKIAKERNKSVVIHCRGNSTIQDICLTTLQKELNREHKIHWHCFNGSHSDYIKRKDAFPNSKFGISPFLLLDEKYPDFRERVCQMELKHLVIETDAPYLHRRKEKEGTPLLTIEIVEKLATMFSRECEEVARITTENTVELYNINRA